jgi:hypothetical protein
MSSRASTAPCPPMGTPPVGGTRRYPLWGEHRVATALRGGRDPLAHHLPHRRRQHRRRLQHLLGGDARLRSVPLPLHLLQLLHHNTPSHSITIKQHPLSLRHRHHHHPTLIAIIIIQQSPSLSYNYPSIPTGLIHLNVLSNPTHPSPTTLVP